MSFAHQEKTVLSIEDISERKFYPPAPENLNQTVLNVKLIEDLIFKFLPVLVDPSNKTRRCSPFDPVPLQNFHHYYKLLCPRTLHRYSHSRGSST